MSRTTIVVDDKLLDEAKKITGEQKTSRVVKMGLETLVRKARMKALADELLGSGITDMTQRDLERLRER
jgi:Arc/MetJ family transcription regulator